MRWPGAAGARRRRPRRRAHARAERAGARARARRQPRHGVARYDRLREDGFLVSARGAGSWLTLPDAAGPAPAARIAPGWGVDLSVASLPAPEPQLGEAALNAARALARRAPSLGYTAAGLPELRAAIARRFRERGVDTGPDQVLVTAGAQHALHLVLRLLCAPGDRVLVDAPAYPRTLAAVRGVRCRAVAVPFMQDGWDAGGWERTLAAAAPRLAVTMPDHHNPTGLTMGDAQRREIVAACARAGRARGRRRDERRAAPRRPAQRRPLAAFDAGGGVVTLGSMSKAAWGGLRLGWIRASPRLVRELAAVRADVDMASPVLEQLLRSSCSLAGRRSSTPAWCSCASAATRCWRRSPSTRRRGRCAGPAAA